MKETAGRGDEERVTREALDAGWSIIAVVGGDGTCSRVADAILRFGPECTLAVVPAGTGNDFSKTLGVAAHTVDQIASLIAEGAHTTIDVGIADDWYFINSCGFGFDASVLQATADIKFLKGDALYIYAALAQLFSYRGLPVELNGAGPDANEELLMVTVSNGPFLGGAFRIAPDASVTDGALDVCLVQDANVIERVRLFAAAMRGTHGRLPAVRMFRTTDITLKFASAPLIELDGELRHARSTEVRIGCVPRALKIIAAKGLTL